MTKITDIDDIIDFMNARSDYIMRIIFMTGEEHGFNLDKSCREKYWNIINTMIVLNLTDFDYEITY